MLGLTKNVAAQAVRTDVDSLRLVDTFAVDDIRNSDTAGINDSTNADTTVKSGTSVKDLEERLGIRISQDALPSAVTAKATDSAVLNMADNVFYLYGDAQVNYEDMQLNAGIITYYQGKNLVSAVPEHDSLGIAVNRPEFSQGQERFTYDSLHYNFKSKRAIVRNARTKYGDGYVFSEQIKRNPDQSLYGLNSIYTTCALDTPHFGIYARKIKVVPNRVIASGPANLHIEQVPTPLFLPFGLFPITQGHKSGFRPPTFTNEERRGVGLLNGGYYFYLNDYVDLLLQASIYSKGSWLTSGVSTYTNRYRYQGAFNFSYAYEKIGEEYEPGASQRKDFLINWRHQSDAKSRPGVGFNASVDAGTGSFYENNTYDVNQITKNQLHSNITYSKQWQNKPYSLTLAARHSQNTISGEVDITVPEVNFYLAQFNPFQGKNPTGTRWYEKITAQYSFSGTNTIRFIDSTFSLDQLALTDFRNGATHNIPVNANFNVLRFFTLEMGANYREYWLTEQMYRYYNSNRGTLDTIDNRGFFTARDFEARMNLNTRIYGLKTFKRGKLAGVRHVVYPSVGIGYLPDYARAPFNYGYSTILSENGLPEYASPYANSIVGAPGRGNFGKFSSNMTYSLNNNLQIKVRTKDSVGSKNISLIDGFSISGAYNLSADSLNWSLVNMDFRTNILDMINISANATFDPYQRDNITDRRIDDLVFNEGGGLARFTRGSIGVGTSFRSLKKEERKSVVPENAEEFNRIMQFGRYDDYADFNVPWNLSLTYAFTATSTISPETKRDSMQYENSFNFRAEFNFTKRWRFDVNSGYNFVTKELNITQINLYRDIHCWEIKLSAIPFGRNKMYFFTINAKAQILQDLKLIRRRDYRDSAVF